MPEENTPPMLTGTILFNGVPVESGLIVFVPDEERGGSGPLLEAELLSGGRFAIPVTDSAGWHRIAVAATQDILPAHFRNPVLSQLSWEVDKAQTEKQSIRIDISAGRTWNVAR